MKNYQSVCCNGPASQNNRVSQAFLSVVAVIIAVLFSLKHLWDTTGLVMYIYGIIDLLCAGTILFCAVTGFKRVRKELLAVSLFFVSAGISTIIEKKEVLVYYLFVFFGLIGSMLVCYLSARIIPDYRSFIRLILFILISIYTALCCAVLVKATGSLFLEVPTEDTFWGCFQGVRLCGLGNPNTIASIGAALVMLSAFGFMFFTKRSRWILVATGLTGWIVLGMSGSRTSQLGAAASVFVLLFAIFVSNNKISFGKSSSVIVIISIALSSVAFVLVFLSFSLPSLIYKGIMLSVGKLFDFNNLINNLTGFSSREIVIDPSMTGRVTIWIKCLKMCFSDLRHVLFGISYLGSEVITVSHGDVVYEYTMSHNVFLEWFWRYGLVGLAIWMVPLVNWCIDGITVLFNPRERLCFRYSAAAAAGMLLMGMAEATPFYPGTLLAPPFFLICGLCVRLNRDREAKKAEEASSGTLSETPEESVE